MNAHPGSDLRREAPPRASLGSVLGKLLLHAGFLLVAVGCLVGYEHFKSEGRPTTALGCLVAAAVLGFAPVRDVVRIVFRIEGTTLHLMHALGGLALIALPLSGAVSGAPVLTRAALAPFAVMGAAQAIMHQEHPRNARQAAAMQRFAMSLSRVAQVAGDQDLASPEHARRAIAALSDILGKAQALGETELESDPRFQSALSQMSTRFGANLGLDVVQLALTRLAANPATAAAVPGLRQRLEAARKTIARAGTPQRHG